MSNDGVATEFCDEVPGEKLKKKKLKKKLDKALTELAGLGMDYGKLFKEYNQLLEQTEAYRIEAKNLRQFIEDYRDLWSRAEDACDVGGCVEGHIIREVAEFMDEPDDTDPRDLLCSLIEKIGRSSHRLLKDIEAP